MASGDLHVIFYGHTIRVIGSPVSRKKFVVVFSGVPPLTTNMGITILVIFCTFLDPLTLTSDCLLTPKSFLTYRETFTV